MTTKTLLKDGEAFLDNGRLSVAFNVSGSLGSRNNAPDGFGSGPGFKRVGIFVHALNLEVMLPGTPLQGFLIGYKKGGKTYKHRNAARDGVATIPGSLRFEGDELIWEGTTPEGLKIHQRALLKGDAISVVVLLTNTAREPITDLLYDVVFDPDHGELDDAGNSGFATDNTIVSRGLVTAKAERGKATQGEAFLYTPDPAAVSSAVAGYKITDPALAALYSGKAADGDSFLALAWRLGDLGPGNRVPLIFAIGVSQGVQGTIAGLTAPVAPEPEPEPEAPAVRTVDVVPQSKPWPAGKVKGQITLTDKTKNAFPALQSVSVLSSEAVQPIAGGFRYAILK